MKKRAAGLCAVVLIALPFLGCSRRLAKSDYPITPVSYKNVRINDAFWAPRIETTRTVTLPYLLDMAEKSGRPGDMRLVEAVSFFHAQNPDPALLARVEGKLDTSLQRIRGLKGKWPTTGDGSLSSAGGLFLGAVAYYEATGSRKLLDAATEIADDLDNVFGPGKRREVNNHEGLKMGLTALYRATGNEKYLRLAKFFLDERGHANGGRQLYGPYAQDHQPVVEQTRAVGHGVRATYLYNALTDIAALTGDPAYAKADQAIWEDAVSKRTYLTGGIGSYRDEEDFGDDYDLPNLSCWNEICAAVGNTWWNHKMFLLNRDAKYLDMMERILYNGLLTGVSLEGDRFLYQAPLKALPSFARQPRFGPNCCPPNITRFLASMGNLIYAHDGQGLYVNLFIGSRAQTTVGDLPVTIEQRTNYPWEGSTTLTLSPGRASRFAVLVRLPGWARNEAMPSLLYGFTDKSGAGPIVTVNGKPATFVVERGFAKIDREWAKGDALELSFPMPVRRVLANQQVADDRGMVALTRGPLVYCAEQADNPGGVFNLVMPDSENVEFVYRKDLLGGVGTISGKALSLSRASDRVSVNRKEQAFTAIPYYAFGNRNPGEMAVWLARDESKAVLPPAPTIASTSRATSSAGNGTVAENYPGQKPPDIARRLYTNAQDGSGDIRAISDGVEPVNSADGSSKYLRLHPQSGDKAWVQYDFAKPSEVGSVEVYWKDDKQYCPAPGAWKLLYKEGNDWIPVAAKTEFGVDKDKFNRVEFSPVKTSGLRMEIQLSPRTYKKGKLGPPDANWLREDLTWYEGGVIEWRVNPAPKAP